VTPQDEVALELACAALAAMEGLEAELASLMEALEAGITWEVATEIRRVMFMGAAQ